MSSERKNYVKKICLAFWILKLDIWTIIGTLFKSLRESLITWSYDKKNIHILGFLLFLDMHKSAKNFIRYIILSYRFTEETVLADERDLSGLKIFKQVTFVGFFMISSKLINLNVIYSFLAFLSLYTLENLR